MRLEVSIPDPVYTDAQRITAESGVSFDRFVSEAVELHLGNEPRTPIPTPELIARLRQAETDMDAGKGLTIAQVEESLAAKWAVWLQANLR